MSLSTSLEALGKLNYKIAELSRRAEVLKAELKASGEHEVLSKHYRCVISRRTTTRLDTGLAKSILTPAEIARCSVESTSTALSLYDR
jgi:hypothetical protein